MEASLFEFPKMKLKLSLKNLQRVLPSYALDGKKILRMGHASTLKTTPVLYAQYLRLSYSLCTHRTHDAANSRVQRLPYPSGN